MAPDTPRTEPETSGPLYWHFVGATLRDGRPVPADGEWLRHDGPVVPCRSGLHASAHPRDALCYAPGNTLCLVELRGRLVPHDGDKVTANERRILARIDATPLLRQFARECATGVLHLWEAPAVVVEYLRTGDGSLRQEAYAAARTAAYAAVYAADAAAARTAAYAAARAAAYAAARAAARTAAYAAAATRAKQRTRFWQLCAEAFPAYTLTEPQS